MSDRLGTMKLRAAKRMWRQLGGTIRHYDHCCEALWEHPHFPRPIRVSDHRDDASGVVRARLSRLRRARCDQAQER